jgi:hypothetical protein
VGVCGEVWELVHCVRSSQQGYSSAAAQLPAWLLAVLLQQRPLSRLPAWLLAVLLQQRPLQAYCAGQCWNPCSCCPNGMGHSRHRGQYQEGPQPHLCLWTRTRACLGHQASSGCTGRRAKRLLGCRARCCQAGIRTAGTAQHSMTAQRQHQAMCHTCPVECHSMPRLNLRMSDSCRK